MSSVLDAPEAPSRFFRCPVASDCGKATLTIRDHQVRALVEEASINGFTVTLSDDYYDEARLPDSWELKYDGRVLEVQPETVRHIEGERIRVWLKQINDLTEFEEIRFFSWKKFFRNRAGAWTRKAIVIMSGGGVITAALLMILLQSPPEIEESAVHTNPFLDAQIVEEIGEGEGVVVGS